MEQEQDKKIIIAKISGKIIENRNKLSSLLNQFKEIIYKKKSLNKIIIIPGGGNAANLIRYIDSQINLSHSKAHWMAILAMNFNAEQISRNFLSLKVLESFKELKKILKMENKGIYLFKPYQFLFNDDFLPHSWDITSDSITLYLAHRLSLPDCFLIKNVNGIISKKTGEILKSITAEELGYLKKEENLILKRSEKYPLKSSQPVDNYVPKFVERFGITCIIINAMNNKILKYFDKSIDKQELQFTKISN